MHSTEKKALALNLLLSLLMAAGYMLLFAYNNTPLGAAIGSDNAMYLTMGTALAKGWAPYVDVFDQKGPLLFALQGLPQWIGGGYNLTAVFLQEVVALFACLTVVRALARALSCPPVWAQLVYLAMTCAFMDGGNLTEEYTNLPTLLALYMALRVFGQEKIGEKLFLPAAGMGVCAAAAFSLRANNALPIFALVAVLALATGGLGELVPAQLMATALVCVGVIGLGIVEAREDEELRLLRQEAGNYKYAKSALALVLPILYCVLDALGTFADSKVLETLNEDSANCAYELTFLAAGIVCFVYVVLIRKQKLVPKREGPKYLGALCETAGQFAYIYALADSEHVALAAPIISAYCVLSVVWSRIFLKEKLSWKHYLMIALVVAGIVILGIYDE